jgi:hypothetical protein
MKYLSWLIVPVLVTGCANKETPKPGAAAVIATTALFKVAQDEFDDKPRYMMQGNVIPDDSTKSAPTLKESFEAQAPRIIELDITGYKGREGKVKYYLCITYIAKDWLFIDDRDESLILLIDGQRVGLKCERYKRKVTTYQQMEMATYPVEYDFLVQISKANKVKVKVMGSEGAEIRYFAKENIKNFGEYVRMYGPAEILKGQGEGTKGEKQ